MYLTGIFNIPVASPGIVKVIFADISIITFYFQCFQFNPKFSCTPHSNVLYKVSAGKWIFFGCVQHTETFRGKTKSKCECFQTEEHRPLKKSRVGI